MCSKFERDIIKTGAVTYSSGSDVLGSHADLKVRYYIMNRYVIDQFFEYSGGSPQIPSTSFPK